MSKIMEKETRGAITKETAIDVELYANEHDWKMHRYRQISIYCNTDHISAIGTVNEGRGRIIIDIRDDAIKVKVKVGNALGFERKEYAIKCTKDSAEAIAVLFSLLGIEEGFIRTFDRTDYKTPTGVQLTVKLNCNMGDHFELERDSDNADVIEDFNRIIDDLKLVMWSKDELAAAIQHDHDTIRASNILETLKEILG